MLPLPVMNEVKVGVGEGEAVSVGAALLWVGVAEGVMGAVGVTANPVGVEKRELLPPRGEVEVEKVEFPPWDKEGSEVGVGSWGERVGKVVRVGEVVSVLKAEGVDPAVEVGIQDGEDKEDGEAVGEAVPFAGVGVRVALIDSVPPAPGENEGDREGDGEEENVVLGGEEGDWRLDTVPG